MQYTYLVKEGNTFRAVLEDDKEKNQTSLYRSMFSLMIVDMAKKLNAGYTSDVSWSYDGETITVRKTI